MGKDGRRRAGRAGLNRLIVRWKFVDDDPLAW